MLGIEISSKVVYPNASTISTILPRVLLHSYFKMTKHTA